MRKIWRRAKPKEEKRFRVNDFIRIPQVFLIDENNVRVGVVAIEEARKKAEEAGLDLVEVDPTPNPSIVKIMDYGQFKYTQEKKSKANQKGKKAEQKSIRLTVRIGKHDLSVRVDQGVKFLQKGHPLLVELQLKGREKAYPQKGEEIMREYLAELEKAEGLSLVRDQDLTKKGGRFTIELSNRR
ncbi:MAG: translation initiation factor IF-3 [Patescibacteria group bacterium]|jgi:translation initiation factor IF-3